MIAWLLIIIEVLSRQEYNTFFYFLEESDAPKCERKHNIKLGINDKELFVHFYA